jgi:hypothetical protein
MGKEDILKMAREAGLSSPILLQMYGGKEDALCDSEIANLRQIERFANLVAEREREECAAMFDNHNVWDEEVGERIRARSQS